MNFCLSSYQIFILNQNVGNNDKSWIVLYWIRILTLKNLKIFSSKPFGKKKKKVFWIFLIDWQFQISPPIFCKFLPGEHRKRLRWYYYRTLNSYFTLYSLRRLHISNVASSNASGVWRNCKKKSNIFKLVPKELLSLLREKSLNSSGVQGKVTFNKCACFSTKLDERLPSMWRCNSTLGRRFICLANIVVYDYVTVFSKRFGKIGKLKQKSVIS